MRKKIVNLVVGTLAFGGAATLVSRYLWPDVPIPLFSLVAAALCLVPTVISLVWADRTGGQNSENQLLMVLGGTALRMALVTQRRFPQITGLEWPMPGIGIFQRTFAPCSTFQVVGELRFASRRGRAIERNEKWS